MDEELFELGRLIDADPAAPDLAEQWYERREQLIAITRAVFTVWEAGDPDDFI